MPFLLSHCTGEVLYMYMHIKAGQLQVIKYIYFLFAEATGAISQGYAFCKYVVQPL